MEIINQQIQLTFSAGGARKKKEISASSQKLTDLTKSFFLPSSFFLTFVRRDQNNSVSVHCGRSQRWPVARGGGSLLQQGTTHQHASRCFFFVCFAVFYARETNEVGASTLTKLLKVYYRPDAAQRGGIEIEKIKLDLQVVVWL